MANSKDRKRYPSYGEEIIVINTVGVPKTNENRWPGKTEKIALMQDEYGTMVWVGNRRQLEEVRKNGGCRRCGFGRVVNREDDEQKMEPGNQFQAAPCVPRVVENGQRRCQMDEASKKKRRRF